MTAEAPARRFWHTMVYECDAGVHRWTFYLEDGCEGPRDGEAVMVRLPADHPFRPGKPTPWPRTASGRFVVPVPFVAGRCPYLHTPAQLQAIEAARRFPSPRPVDVMVTHVRWSEDRDLAPTVEDDDVPYEAGRFLYPPPGEIETDPNACGIPVFPPVREAERFA